MKISAKTLDEFKEQFKTLLRLNEFNQIENIVYFWKVENPFPRLVGESNILYIGKTKYSFSNRYSIKKAFDIECFNFEKTYKPIIEQYGAIYIEIVEADNPSIIEWQELSRYRDKHLEYPPLNRAIPNMCAPINIATITSSL